MTVYFVTGIDTDTGKSMATGMLARFLLRQGKKVITQKLIQTGQKEKISEDILQHRRLMGIDPMPEDLLQSFSTGSLTCPYSFSFPASPHLAANLEGRTIESVKITEATETLQKRFDIILLEGTGGFFVPITAGLWTADYVAERRYPVILVTSGKLGSINHTALTLEAIRQRNIPFAGLVFNQYPLSDETICKDTLELFRLYCSQIVILPIIESNQCPDVDFSILVQSRVKVPILELE